MLVFNSRRYLYFVVSLILATVLIAGWFCWFELRPIWESKQSFRVIKKCEAEIYNRKNELNYEWAEGKKWKPITEDITGEHGWMYSDQNGSLKSSIRKLTLFQNCLQNGLVK